MPTNHSSRGRRHRGRRGRRSGNRDETRQQQPAGGEEVTMAEPDIAGSEPPVAIAEAETPVPPARAQRRPPGNAPRGKNDTRGGSQRAPGRRRNQPRQTMGPMPTAVLKRGVTVGPPERVRESRSVASMTSTDIANFGCPMLTRIATRMPATGFQNAPRCSMAWALHNEDEALLCMYTADMLDCWKAHPEKVEGLRARIAEDAATPAAD